MKKIIAALFAVILGLLAVFLSLAIPMLSGYYLGLAIKVMP